MAEDCGGENLDPCGNNCLCRECAATYREQSIQRGNDVIRLGREVVTLRARVKELEQLPRQFTDEQWAAFSSDAHAGATSAALGRAVERLELLDEPDCASIVRALKEDLDV